ncbi:MAG TPA: hypothetical protein VI749_07715 [Candidatus Omnitrophota bacterium]|nr:hypothetical protein [Candidatus Omnitrophota bacterium]
MTNIKAISVAAGIFLIPITSALALSDQAPSAGNGGNIFRNVDKLQLRKEDDAKRAKDAIKRTEQLNKNLKAQRKKEAKAVAKAKKLAEKKKVKVIRESGYQDGGN